MPRKAKAAEEAEPKKKTTKKAAATADAKPAKATKAEKAPKATKATKAKKATIAEDKAPKAKKAAAKKTVSKKAVPAPEPEPVAARNPKRAVKKKAAAAEISPELALDLEPAATLSREKAEPAVPLAPAPVPAPPEPEPQPAGPSVVTQAASPPPPAPAGLPPSSKSRPLYIPRDVEAFLRAAHLPMPTDRAQLDAIMNLVNAARAAATGHASPAVQQASHGQGHVQGQHQRAPQQQQPQQPGQQPGQQRPSREDRRKAFLEKRKAERDMRRQNQQQRHQDSGGSPAGDGQYAPQADGQDGGQSSDGAPQPGRQDEPFEIVEAEGYCEISGKGFGFLREPGRNFVAHPMDVFVMPEVVKRHGIKDGHWLKVEARKNNRGMQIHRLISVNDQPPENVKTWPSFEDLTSISPIEHIKLETVTDRTTTRVMDLLTPIGKGQRGLIVAPPRTGKTTLLNHIANAVITNHPEIKLMILLVDERPEEVTDFRCNVPQAELWASSNDQDTKSHVRVATLAIERARRLVESGQDVFILLDSITRLGRAFNNAIAGGGRTMSGGVDSRALEVPRKIFAAARNTEEAGSLTIVATALVETGSRMDELIFQEFKGTGNSEVVLDRLISNQRIYPAIDIFQSGTRREELILPADRLHKINVIRRGLAGHRPIEAIERVLSFIKRFPTNDKLLAEIPG